MLSQSALTRRPSNKRQCSDPDCNGIITDFFNKDCPDCRQKKRSSKHGHYASGSVLSSSAQRKPKPIALVNERGHEIPPVDPSRRAVPAISQDRVVSSMSQSQARKLAASDHLAPPASTSHHSRPRKKPRIEVVQDGVSSVKDGHQQFADSVSSHSVHTVTEFRHARDTPRVKDDHVAASSSVRKPAPFPMTAQDMAPTPAPPEPDDITDVDSLLEASLPIVPVSKKFPPLKSAMISSSASRLGSTKLSNGHPNKKRKMDVSIPSRIVPPTLVAINPPNEKRRAGIPSSPLVSSPVLATIDDNVISVPRTSLSQPDITALGEESTKTCSTCHQEMSASIRFKQCDSCRERGREQARRFTERKRQMQLGEIRISSPTAAEQEATVDKIPRGSKRLSEPQEYQTSSLMYANLKKKKRSRKTFNFYGTFTIVADPRASLVRHIKHAHRDLRKIARLSLGDLVSESNNETIASAIYRCRCAVTAGPTLPDQELTEPCKGMISIDISVDTSHVHFPGERTTIRIMH